jgi:hypothetical protein
MKLAGVFSSYECEPVNKTLVIKHLQLQRDILFVPTHKTHDQRRRNNSIVVNFGDDRQARVSNSPGSHGLKRGGIATVFS